MRQSKFSPVLFFILFGLLLAACNPIAGNVASEEELEDSAREATGQSDVSPQATATMNTDPSSPENTPRP